MENLKNLNLKAKVAILVAFLVFMAALIAWVVSQCNKKTQVRQKETMLLPNQGGSGDKPIFHLSDFPLESKDRSFVLDVDEDSLILKSQNAKNFKGIEIDDEGQNRMLKAEFQTLVHEFFISYGSFFNQKCNISINSCDNGFAIRFSNLLKAKSQSLPKKDHKDLLERFLERAAGVVTVTNLKVQTMQEERNSQTKDTLPQIGSDKKDLQEFRQSNDEHGSGDEGKGSDNSDSNDTFQKVRRSSSLSCSVSPVDDIAQTDRQTQQVSYSSDGNGNFEKVDCPESSDIKNLEQSQSDNEHDSADQGKGSDNGDSNGEFQKVDHLVSSSSRAIDIGQQTRHTDQDSDAIVEKILEDTDSPGGSLSKTKEDIARSQRKDELSLLPKLNLRPPQSTLGAAKATGTGTERFSQI